MLGHQAVDWRVRTYAREHYLTGMRVKHNLEHCSYRYHMCDPGSCSPEVSREQCSWIRDQPVQWPGPRQRKLLRLLCGCSAAASGVRVPSCKRLGSDASAAAAAPMQHGNTASSVPVSRPVPCRMRHAAHTLGTLPHTYDCAYVSVTGSAMATPARMEPVRSFFFCQVLARAGSPVRPTVDH